MALTRWGKKRETLQVAEHYLNECCEHLGLSPKEFSKSARRFIVTRRWPDEENILRQAVYGAAISSSNSEVTAGHFAPYSRRDRHEFVKVQTHELALDELMREKITHFYTKLGKHDVEGVYKTIMDQVERPLMQETLTHVGGNKLKAARILGINRNTLARKIRAHNLVSTGE